MLRLSFAFLFALTTLSPAAYAGSAATLVLREGQVVHLNDGFESLVDAYRQLGKARGDFPHIFQMTLNGSTFLIDLAEVVIVCRDQCSSISISDPRRTDQPQNGR